MGEFLRPVLELMVLLPGMLLAYLPMKQYLRMRPAVLTAVAVPLALLLCLAGGAVGCFVHVDTVWLFFPAVAVMGFSISIRCRSPGGSLSASSLPYAACSAAWAAPPLR